MPWLNLSREICSMVRISFFTCVFLIGLRLVIGWHFFFEGVAKYESLKKEGAEGAKVFTSEGYFAEAEGPLGPKMREIIGDPNLKTLANLKLAGSGENRPANAKMPVALAKEWDDYLKAFLDTYKPDEPTRKAAEAKLDQAKSDYVMWLEGTKPAKDIKPQDLEPEDHSEWIIASSVFHPALIYRPKAKVDERVKSFNLFLIEIRDVYEKELPVMGKDVESARLRILKTKAAEIRTDLNKSIDEHAKKYKDSLAKLVEGRLDGFSIGPPEDFMNQDSRLLEMLTLKEGMGSSAERVPPALAKQWDDYFAFYKEAGRDDPKRDLKAAEQSLADAKLRYVRYLLDLNPFSGEANPNGTVAERLTSYKAAEAKVADARKKFDEEPTLFNYAAVSRSLAGAASPRQSFVKDLRDQTDYLKQSLGGFTESKKKDYDNFKGTVEVKKEKPTILGIPMPAETKLEWLDWSTRWMLLVAGGCLLIGLFTRLACFACIVFLISEIASNTPLPWLPTSPKAEGNYNFLNKNAVELLALLVLITLPTGRWLGIDAWLSRIWPFRRKES